MTFPKIDYPIIMIEVPTTKKSLKFRPMIVKEEKILLTSKAGDSETDIFLHIKQIVNNCCLEESDVFDIDKISLLDLEYLFLKLRGYSIGNVINLSYKDIEDDVTRDFAINLDDIKIVHPNTDPNNNIISVSEHINVIMRYPPATLYSNKDFLNAEDNEEIAQEILISCIYAIEESGQKHVVNHDKEKTELEEFINNLEAGSARKLNDFFENVPKMEYIIKYTNDAGTEREIVLNTLNDFFTLL